MQRGHTILGTSVHRGAEPNEGSYHLDLTMNCSDLKASRSSPKSRRSVKRRSKRLDSTRIRFYDRP